MSERVILRGRVVTAVLALATLVVAGGAHARGAGCAAPPERALASPGGAWLADVTGSVMAFRAPGVRPFARFGLHNLNGAPTVFGVVSERFDDACRPAWFHVALPMRPNGSTGWVRAGKVRLS